MYFGILILDILKIHVSDFTGSIEGPLIYDKQGLLILNLGLGEMNKLSALWFFGIYYISLYTSSDISREQSVIYIVV